MKNGDLLILLNAFWNYGKGLTGGDQIAKQVFTRIAENYKVVNILTNSEGHKLFQEIPNTRRMEHGVFTEFRFTELTYVLRTIQAIFKVLRIKVDYIYTGSDFFPDVIPAYIYKLLHPQTRWCQVVFHIYPYWNTRPGSRIRAILGFYLQRFSHYLIRKADCTLCINTLVKTELVKRGIQKEKLVLIYPGVNYTQIISTPPDREKYNATFLARLRPTKGIYDLIGIWEAVVKESPDARLAIIGQGTKEIVDELQNQINSKNLKDNIDILGYLEDDHAHGLIKSSEVFIFPSHEEGFGIAIAEALACGTPAIAWNLPVYQEVFGNNIIAVTENNYAMFAKEIVRLCNDQQLRKKMSEEGLKFISKYSWDNVAKQYLTCLTNN